MSFFCCSFFNVDTKELKKSLKNIISNDAEHAEHDVKGKRVKRDADINLEPGAAKATSNKLSGEDNAASVDNGADDEAIEKVIPEPDKDGGAPSETRTNKAHLIKEEV